MAKILWIDNDRLYLAPLKLRLEIEGYDIKQCFTLKEGLDEVRNRKYDLLIVDCMMTVSSEEEDEFPVSSTDYGREAGLALYKKLRDLVIEQNTPVVVLTIRDEDDIRTKWLDAGLEDTNYFTKLEARKFADRVGELLKKD